MAKKVKSEKQAAVAAQQGSQDQLKGNVQLKMILSGFLFFVAALLYVNTIGNDYALDDVAVTHQNKFTQQGFAGIDDMLHTFYWQGYWDTNAGLYRPLSLITFAIEWQFFPNNPHVQHTVNVLLYGVIAMLLFLLLLKLFKSRSVYVSFIATLLFVVHAAHTEVVANIKSRDELLCFLFFIITANQLLLFFENGRSKNLWLAGITYFLCLFSKEGGLVFLPIFPLMIYFFSDRKLKDISFKLWSLALSAFAFLAIHWMVISNAPKPKINYTYLDNALVAAPNYMSRLATAIYMMGDYFKLLIFPHPLSYDYSFNQIPSTTFANVKVLLVLLIVGYFIYQVSKGFKSRNVYSFCILFFFITISMTSNIITLIGATMADRFLFVPSLGFSMAIAFLMDAYFNKSKQDPETVNAFFMNGKTMLLLVGVVCSLHAVKTIARNQDWKNDFTLFEKDVKAAPGSSRTHYNYGTIYMDRVAMKEKDPEKKKQLLQTAIVELEESARIDVKAYNAYHNLGICYYHSQQYAKSIASSLKSAEINPTDASTFNNLGNAYFRNNEYDKAIEALNKSIQMGFVADDTYNFLGSSYFGKGEYQKAIENFTKALEKNSSQPDVLNNIASAYGTIREFDKAIVYFKKAYELNPQNGQTCYFIAITYRSKGETAAAQEWFDKAKALGVKF